MDKKLKLAEKISKRLKIPYYIGRYQTGVPLLGYGKECFLFFKEQDLSPAALRLWRIKHLGFKQNEEFGILETNLSEFSPKGKYRIIHQSEHGKIYTK